MLKNSKISFIGGDLRHYYMAKQLHSLGFQVAVYGLKVKDEDNMEKSSSIEDAISYCDIIIGPIPFSKDKVNIVSFEEKNDLTIADILAHLKPTHKLYGGLLPDNVTDFCEQQKIYYRDFMKIETVSISNAIATAEGTIVEAIKLSPMNFHHSNCLILGYGRCGKVLADKCKGLNARVTIGARSSEQLTLADSLGYSVVLLSDLPEKIGSFDFIFNTIPSMVLNRELLMLADKEVTIIDIASKPGGTDFNACKELGIQAKLSLSLPGIYSPKTSAEILNFALLHD